MSGQQNNVWARPRNSQSASRTPQSRSTTASPGQPANPTQPPRQDGGRPQQQNNVWMQRNSQSGDRQSATSNGSSTSTPQLEVQYMPANGFNSNDVKSFLARDAQSMPAVYKSGDGPAGARAGGGAWGSRTNHTANNQPFFVQLAKQVATLEGGG